MRPTLINQLRLLVPIKRTIDYAVKIRVNPQQTGVETNGVKHSLNPFDEIAVEEAVRLREKLKEKIELITVVTIAPKKGGQEVLRTALAMGADEALHIELPETSIENSSSSSSLISTESNGLSSSSPEPIIIAKLLKEIVEKQKIDLVICGKQAIDDDASQVGGMLAALLNWPQAQFASKVEMMLENNSSASSSGSSSLSSVKVDREIDGGLETLELQLPAVITTDLRLNEPRYASLPNIMKAKKKKITSYSIKDFNVDLTPRLKVLKVEAPPVRQGGTKVDDVDAVISKLKELGAL